MQTRKNTTTPESLRRKGGTGGGEGLTTAEQRGHKLNETRCKCWTARCSIDRRATYRPAQDNVNERVIRWQDLPLANLFELPVLVARSTLAHELPQILEYLLVGHLGAHLREDGLVLVVSTVLAAAATTTAAAAGGS